MNRVRQNGDCTAAVVLDRDKRSQCWVAMVRETVIMFPITYICSMSKVFCRDTKDKGKLWVKQEGKTTWF